MSRSPVIEPDHSAESAPRPVIIPARVPDESMLRAQNNELIFAVSGDGAASFGDLVVLYTSNELTERYRL
jgi:hypothetical protein